MIGAKNCAATLSGNDGEQISLGGNLSNNSPQMSKNLECELFPGADPQEVIVPHEGTAKILFFPGVSPCRPACITLYRAKAHINKLIEKGENSGEIVKTSLAHQAYNKNDFRAEQAQVHNLKCLLGILKNQSEYTCLSNGIFKGMKVGDTRKVVTARQRKLWPTRERVTRTKKMMYFPEDKAGVLILDYDGEPIEAKELNDLLRELVPEFRDTDIVFNPSSSSYIYDSEKVTQITGAKGWHVYILINKASEIPMWGKYITQRSWLCGHGKIQISKAGSQLVREKYFDSCVYSEERLFYSIPSLGPGLTRNSPGPLLFPGTFGAVKKPAPVLSDEEVARVKELQDIEKRKTADEALAIRNQYCAELVDKKMKSLPENERTEAAREKCLSTTKKHLDGGFLPFDLILHMQDGSTLTIADLAAHPNKYRNRSCADPLEPDYANGDNRIAKIYPVEGKNYVATIFSFAHGGITHKVPALPNTNQDDAVEVEPEISALNASYAVVMWGAKTYVMWEHLDGDGTPCRTFMAFNDFRNKISNRYFVTYGANGKPKQIPLAKYWLEHPQRRQYDGVVFSPSRKVRQEHYNLWRGFAVEPQEGNWGRMQEHIFKVICRSDEQLYVYVMAWMAYLVQNLGSDRPGVALVLLGGQGTGKGMLVKFLGMIFGCHYKHITQQSQLTGNFNSHLQDALLVFVDEGFWAGNRQAEGTLKAMITEDKIAVEAKGKDVIMQDNRMSLIMASNNDWVIPAGRDERRYLVLPVSDERQGDFEYFKALQREMEDGGVEAMLYDLLDMDIADVNLRSVPRTHALFQQKLRTMPPEEKWWFEVLVTGKMRLPAPFSSDHTQSIDIFSKGVSSRELHTAYLHFTREQRSTYPITQSELSSKIKDWVGINTGTRIIRGESRLRGYEIPPLGHCRERFSQIMHADIDWHTFSPSFEGSGSQSEPCIPGFSSEDDHIEDDNLGI